MYKLVKLPNLNEQCPCVMRLQDSACIPFDPANSDYQQFKKHLAEGRELQDADGIPLSTQAVAEFLEKLS